MKIKLRSALVIATVLLTLPSLAFAQNTRDAELAMANDDLNATYRYLMKRLDAGDQAALRSAQRTWIVFRDADCSFGWGDKRDCLINRTTEREQQFRNSTYLDAKGQLINIPQPRN